MAKFTEPPSTPKQRGSYGSPLTGKLSEFRSRTLLDFSTSDRATKRVIAPYVRIVRKGQMAAAVTTKVEDNKMFNFYVQKKPSLCMRDLSSCLSDSVDLQSVLNETADVLKSVTKALGVSLYIVDNANNEIYQNPKNVQDPRHKVNWKIGDGRTVASFVAQHKEFVMLDDVLGDDRFPDGVGHQDQLIKSVMCVPVVTPLQECLAVLELYRDFTQGPFQKEDLRVTIAIAGWMGAALDQNQKRLILEKQQQLNDYLLDLIKCYFTDTMLKDKMISEFVRFAKLTLSAERGSFFIIKKGSRVLAADLYEEGIGDTSVTMLKKNLKIQLAKEKSIAAVVAQTRQTINVKDAYSDPRYSKEVDGKTGSITRSILCMPVLGVDEILGVIQVVNKKNAPCFTTEDEDLFKTFCAYCALALHFSNLENGMGKTNHLNDVYLKMVQFHIKPCIHDMKALTKGVEIPERFNNFDWYVSEEEKQFMPHYSVYMFVSVIGDENLIMDKTLEFVLSCRKSYRNNPYHNFEHAFTVTHCMYNVLMRNKDVFTQLEQESLLIAAICHDLDHMGVTNNFLSLTNDILHQLYDESPLESHHYHVAMTIFKDCNMFQSLPKEKYTEMAEEIKYAILATDLATHFRLRAKILQICHDNAFNFENPKHRYLLKANLITCCDLSGQCKPYSVTKKITENVYKEFYNQGDTEKSMGLTPLSMMDREKKHMIPGDQVHFLTVVVEPCTDILMMLLPNTEPLNEECRNLRDTWKDIIALRDQKCWQQEKSTAIMK